MLRLGTFWTVLMAVAASPLIGEAQAQSFYKGKTLSIIVGFAAGGGVDADARLVAQFLEKHLEGNPNVIVRNMAGAASIQAKNYVFEQARPDGLTVFYGPWFPVSQIVSAPGVRFKYEEFALVAAGTSASSVVYARSGLLPGKSTDPADIVRVDKLVFAGAHPTNPQDARGRLALDLLGMPYRYVPGYQGSARIRAALLNREADVGMDSIRGYLGAVKPTMVDTGDAIPLWEFPEFDQDGNYVRRKDLDGVPTFEEVYQRAFGKPPSGQAWTALELIQQVYGTSSHFFFGPPKMNPEARAALSKAIYAVRSDPEYIAEAERRFGEAQRPVPIKTAAQAIRRLAEIDPDIRKFIQEHVKAGLE